MLFRLYRVFALLIYTVTLIAFSSTVYNYVIHPDKKEIVEFAMAMLACFIPIGFMMTLQYIFFGKLHPLFPFKGSVIANAIYSIVIFLMLVAAIVSIGYVIFYDSSGNVKANVVKFAIIAMISSWFIWRGDNTTDDK